MVGRGDQSVIRIPEYQALRLLADFLYSFQVILVSVSPFLLKLLIRQIPDPFGKIQGKISALQRLVRRGPLSFLFL